MPYSRANPSQAYMDGVRACSHVVDKGKLFHGKHVFLWFNLIRDFFKEHNVKTAVDYGCGRGDQHKEVPHLLTDGTKVMSLGSALGVDFTCYDPAVPGFDQLPAESKDAVVVSNVLEFVSEVDCPWVLAEIFGLATKCVFIAATPLKPKKMVEPYDRPIMWWLELLHQAAAPTKVDWFLRLQVTEACANLYRRNADKHTMFGMAIQRKPFECSFFDSIPVNVQPYGLDQATEEDAMRFGKDKDAK